jgi:hypothetical protein
MGLRLSNIFPEKPLKATRMNFEIKPGEVGLKP